MPLAAEIRRFWPPLRSLETIHDNVSFKQLDEFIERMLSNSTPLPSPPKTPQLVATADGESSSERLGACAASSEPTRPLAAFVQRCLKNTARQLSKITLPIDTTPPPSVAPSAGTEGDEKS